MNALEKLFKECCQTRLPPVHLWNPEHCGDIGLKIDNNGIWHYQGSPIRRKPMTKLFSSILRQEPDGTYVLVTPVEKIVIEVEDVPFMAVEFSIQEPGEKQAILIRTNVDDVIRVDAEHPLSFRIDPENEGVKPYIEVRSGLKARFTRAMTHELLNKVEEYQTGEGDITLGFWSSGTFFPLTQISGIE